MKLGIIVGTTRQNRQTVKQAKWVLNAAAKLDGIDAELVDLKDYPMPFFDEPISPRYNPDRKIDPAAVPWLKKLEEFDAYVFVTAEYNHAIPGVLKNALDYVTWEIQRKPAAVVSHGSAGGARASINLKIVLSESKAVPLPTFSPLAMTGMSELIDDDGNLTDAAKTKPYDLNDILADALAELKWYSDALAAARNKDQ
ncbi:MAG TPA: NAD(P)H-dependent oxidoreductase [Verrucomicrobiae bacterium]|nr:NAD(P)H-dependent oxidoreductase [Verrucomicrobiae bacterium]